MKSPGIAGNLLLFGLALMCQAPLVKASFFTNVMSGVTNSYGTYQLGDSNDSYDYLQIDSGGALFDNAAFVGGGTGGFPGSNNTVLVTGYGSLWSSSSPGPYSLVFGGGHRWKQPHHKQWGNGIERLELREPVRGRRQRGRRQQRGRHGDGIALELQRATRLRV